MSRKDKSSGVFNDLDKEMEKSTDERFLRLEEDGDKVLVFFAGQPFTRYTYWDGQQTHEWSEGCGQKKNLRLAMNVIICSVGESSFDILSTKVFEQGKRFYQSVSRRDKKYGIHNWLFEVERSGSKGDKETRYDIEAEYELSDKEREELMAIELFDLEEFYAELNSSDSDKKQRKPDKPPKDEEAEEDDDDALIDKEELGELIKMFRTLGDPEAAGRKFCEEFDIKKVKDLRRAQLKKALKYLDKLIAAEQPESDDESPF